MTKISCIMPSYNEESRIAGILTTVAKHPLVTEIIVVDDGSKDKSAEVVRNLSLIYPKIKQIVKAVNEGKSKAMRTGIMESTGDFLMFVDSDLVGVTEQEITDLIEPITSGRADVTISLLRNVPAPWKWIDLDYISGERIMPRQFLLEHYDKFPLIPRFGLEVFINRWIIKNNYKIKVVPWPTVDSIYKYKKYGVYKGLKGDFFMILDIFQTIGLFGPLYQIIKMKKLMVK